MASFFDEEKFRVSLAGRIRNLTPNHPAVRIWGRCVEATDQMALEGNAWAVDPDDLVRIMMEEMNKFIIHPYLADALDALEAHQPHDDDDEICRENCTRPHRGRQVCNTCQQLWPCPTDRNRRYKESDEEGRVSCPSILQSYHSSPSGGNPPTANSWPTTWEN
jgi:hypothetical protein